jgi:hypothetical protein
MRDINEITDLENLRRSPVQRIKSSGFQVPGSGLIRGTVKNLKTICVVLLFFASGCLHSNRMPFDFLCTDAGYYKSYYPRTEIQKPEAKVATEKQAPLKTAEAQPTAAPPAGKTAVPREKIHMAADFGIIPIQFYKNSRQFYPGEGVSIYLNYGDPPGLSWFVHTDFTSTSTKNRWLSEGTTDSAIIGAGASYSLPMGENWFYYAGAGVDFHAISHELDPDIKRFYLTAFDLEIEESIRDTVGANFIAGVKGKLDDDWNIGFSAFYKFAGTKATSRAYDRTIGHTSVFERHMEVSAFGVEAFLEISF